MTTEKYAIVPIGWAGDLIDVGESIAGRIHDLEHIALLEKHGCIAVRDVGNVPQTVNKEPKQPEEPKKKGKKQEQKGEEDDLL